MTEYIFYTPEGYTEAPNGELIENHQFIGTAYGNNRAEALQDLLQENPWIEEYGYDVNEFIIRRLMPPGEDDKLW